MPIFAAALALGALSGPLKKASISVSIGPVIEAFRPIALTSAPSGSLFAAAMEDGGVRIIDSKTHQTVRALRKHVQPAYALAFSSDGRILASGDESGRIWLENALTGAAIRGYRTHVKGIEKLSFNALDNLLLSTGKDDQCNVYDLTSTDKKEVRKFLGHGENYYGAQFDPQSSRYFTVGMLGGGLRKYDAVSGQLMSILPDPDGQGIWDLAYNPNGTREVSAGRDGNALVWDTKTNKKIASLKGHQDWITNTAISPNGLLAATASTDRTVKVWNLQTYAKVADIPQQDAIGSPLCFTADGAYLISVTDTGFLEMNNLTPAQSPLDVLGTVKVNSRKKAPKKKE